MTNDSNSSVRKRERLPHAILERDSRAKKAQKIVALVGKDRFHRAKRILEVGCGSGIISSNLALLGNGGLEIHAVDVIDSRVEKCGYAFHMVEGSELPFEDEYFDIVITNHVIEHVGSTENQINHLLEIRRVLSRSGVVYLAVPNKWRLIEPHYRLPLLSWLPQNVSDLYLRLARKGTFYDCRPLGFEEALRHFEAASLMPLDKTIAALRETLSIEFPRNRLARTFNRLVPDWVPRLCMPMMPTYVFLLHRTEA